MLLEINTNPFDPLLKEATMTKKRDEHQIDHKEDHEKKTPPQPSDVEHFQESYKEKGHKTFDSVDDSDDESTGNTGPRSSR